ncbi:MULTISPECIES: hypothetical protein [Actinomycetes]|uniref:hypothetical protein n=1 Tax=Actinomycetes TaxID=1760 RepID=UPI0005419ADB|nr:MULTISPECIES: hypothetical protein [Actinomycetes]MDK9299985.1 hypothetical protein [Propionibacterium freudenreichii]MDK9641700.1 hypothetical protein [Propionibacterium freudenreichii]WBF59968.1 hypothetical protein LJ113_01470 [Propionibacterium freudenreichii]WBF63561.1 hypothetical protein LJ112_08720 [Propionibacterium freudenreichii]CEH08404.1 Hypothetical protein PFCIRM139_09240 [Propionibacterium freudenreichii]
MRRSRCAAAVFSIALAVGATLGAVTVFVSVFVSLRATPAARPDLDSWTGAANVAAVAAIVGAIVGLIVAAASWSVAALVLVLVARRWRAPAVRVAAVALGSAAGAALVLWFFATRPGVMLDAGAFAALAVVAAALAVVALLVSERRVRSLSPQS